MRIYILHDVIDIAAPHPTAGRSRYLRMRTLSISLTSLPHRGHARHAGRPHLATMPNSAIGASPVRLVVIRRCIDLLPPPRLLLLLLLLLLMVVLVHHGPMVVGLLLLLLLLLQ